MKVYLRIQHSGGAGPYDDWESLHRKLQYLPDEYRLHVWGLGAIAVGRRVRNRARAGLRRTGRFRVLVSRIGAKRAPRRATANLPRYSGAYVYLRGRGSNLAEAGTRERVQYSTGRRTGRIAPGRFMERAAKHHSGDLPVFRRAVERHFILTARQIASGRLTRSRARLLSR